jgi:aspartate/methionine/tyrosine aminotransferase
MQLFRQIYQYANFCGNTPAQIALTQYMQQHPEHIAELADFYQQNEIRLIWVYNNHCLALLLVREPISRPSTTLRFALT